MPAPLTYEIRIKLTGRQARTLFEGLEEKAAMVRVGMIAKAAEGHRQRIIVEVVRSDGVIIDKRHLGDWGEQGG